MPPLPFLSQRTDAAAFGPYLPLEEVPLDVLTNILLLHVVPNAALSSRDLGADDFDGSAVPTLNANGACHLDHFVCRVEELDGERLVRVAGPGNSKGGAASVVVANVLGLNAIVHVIYTVLLP